MSWIWIIAIVAVLLLLKQGSAGLPKILGGDSNVKPEKTQDELDATALAIEKNKWNKATETAISVCSDMVNAIRNLKQANSDACGVNANFQNDADRYISRLNYIKGRMVSQWFVIPDDLTSLDTYFIRVQGQYNSWWASLRTQHNNRCYESVMAVLSAAAVVSRRFSEAVVILNDFYAHDYKKSLHDGKMPDSTNWDLIP